MQPPGGGRSCLHGPNVSVYVDLFRYRELFGSLFRRDLRAKYRGSVLGLAWSLALPLTLRLRGGGRRGRLKGLLLLQGVLTLLIAAVFLPLDEARSAGWFVGGILWDHPTLSPHAWLPEEEWAAFATWGMVAFGAAALLVLGPFKLIFRSLMGPTRQFFAAVLRTALVGGLFGLLWAGSRLLF